MINSVMTTPVAPNSISMTQIATEAGIPTTNADLNNSAIRSLAGVTGDSTTISFSQLQGKSSFTPLLRKYTTDSNGQFVAGQCYTDTVPAGAKHFSILMVGGGGGGGATWSYRGLGDGGGGGGAGGVIISPASLVPVTSGTEYTFNIGAGGNGGNAHDSCECIAGRGGTGGYTSLLINCTTIIAPGGGGGGGNAGLGFRGSPSGKVLQGLPGANGGGASGSALCQNPDNLQVYNGANGNIKYMAGGAGIPATCIRMPSGWTYYGGNQGGAALDNGLNGGGGGGIRVGANAYNTIPTGGPGGTPSIPGYGLICRPIAGGGGAGGNFTNNTNDGCNACIGALFGTSGVDYRNIITANGLTSADGGGGIGGAGVDVNGSQINDVGHPGTSYGAGGGGGGGNNGYGGAGADGAIYIYIS